MEGDKPIEEVKLSAAQKKKLKEKQKKDAAAAEALEKGGAGVEVKPAETEAKGKAVKKKPLNAAAAAAIEKKRLIAEAKAEDDAILAKINEEEDRVQFELDEKNRLFNEVDEAKKKEKRDAVQKLKDAGTWLSKKELGKKRAMEAKRADLIAQGIIKETDEQDGDKPMKASQMIRKNKNKDRKKQNKTDE